MSVRNPKPRFVPQEPPVPYQVAASAAPVSDPARAGSKPVSAGPAVPRPLTPDEAEAAARRTQQARGDRTTRTLTGAREPAAAPATTPSTHAPLHFTPVLLVLGEMLLDMIMIVSAFALAYALRFSTDIQGKFVVSDPSTYAAMLIVTVVTVITTFYFSKLYTLKRGASRVDEFYKIAAAVSMGTVLSLATNSLILGDEFIYSRQILLTGWMMTIVFVTVGRLLYGVGVGQLRRAGIDRARVLVVGTGPTAAMVIDRLDRHPTLGYKVVGALDYSTKEEARAVRVGRVPVLGDITRITQAIRQYRVDEVVVALSGASDKELRNILGRIQDETVSIKIYPDAFQLMTQNEVSVGELSGLPLLSVKDVALRGWNRQLKRAFDILFSLMVLILTAPFMLVIAIIVKMSSPGPVFFIQERVGLDGKPFKLVKFRTMRTDIDETKVPKLADGMPGWTVKNDPRRTAIGAFLRRFSLDELPQFYNVLVGEMSVVGPRPEQPEYVQEFAKRIPQYLRRHREKAGITGWAQVNGLRGDSSIELRTAADLYYVENWSLLFDLKIIVRTIVAMMFGKNAY